MNDLPTTPHRSSRPRRSTCDFPLPQLMSPEEVAGYLGISAFTVRQRLKAGDIPGRKHGARWLVRVVDLEAYVAPNNAP